VDPADAVRWTSLAAPAQRATLDAWCASVGPPVVLEAEPKRGPISRLVVVTWNLHVGGGRVDRFLDWLGKQPWLLGQQYGLVLLLEEAFRAGASVAATYPAGLDVPKAIRPGRPAADITGLATALSMHLAYVPSMRNGPAVTGVEREDRGNAILSTEPLEDVEAIELPFGKQRRVAVGATIDLRGGGRLRVVAVHLDTRRKRQQGAAFADYLSRLDRDVPTIVGADLNTLFGRRERTFTMIASALPVEECGGGKTTLWPWRLDIPFGWWRGRVDFMFGNLPAPTAGRRCWTVGEAFGSDHRPVVMVVPAPLAFPGD
jgi:endonuclease/exonuclease/phosphatase family metal-dependent hydrolase